MALRITLISANRLREPYPVYPLGTAYLRSYLEARLPECTVEIIDMNLTTEEELATHLATTPPDYVGLSIRNVDGANSLDRRAFFLEYKSIARIIKENSSAPFIIGGTAYSIFPDQFIEELDADYGIVGEGEEAWVQLVTSLQKGISTESIGALYTTQKPATTPCQYISSPQALYEPQLVDYYWRHSGMLNIQTKRGCPYNCIYCTYPHIDGRRVRCMEVDAIVDTLERAKHDFGASYWFFTDSVFNIHKEFNAALCEEIIRRNLHISWGAYFTPSNITDEQMALYHRSGLTHIEYGTESFCDTTLEAYGKRFTFDDVARCSELALKHNVYYAHFLILAGWGESKAELHETIEHSRHLRHTVIFPYVGMRIYPHTRLYDYAMQERVIDETTDLLMPSYYVTKGFDLEETRSLARATGKAWIFPDEPASEMMTMLKVKRNKKGPLWEYLRKP